jgi:serine/threonine-protein kinase
VERFKREVQLTSQLTHPNTIAIYDYGATAAGDFYYAMEYLEGMALDRLASEHAPIGEARVVHILRQVLDSLAEAHAIGLVHRDIKPANIMLCRRGGISDVVKVLDFGLVKQTGLEGNTQLTDMQTLTGTPQFLSPEAIDSPGAVDALSDLYQVAAVGYLLLTGHYVFEGDSVVEVCYQHVSTPPVPPSERLGAPVSKDLEDLILQALSKSKEERPRSARAMSEALGRCAIEGHWTRADADAWWTLTRPVRADEPGETEPTATRVRVGDLDLRLGGTR